MLWSLEHETLILTNGFYSMVPNASNVFCTYRHCQSSVDITNVDTMQSAKHLPTRSPFHRNVLTQHSWVYMNSFPIRISLESLFSLCFEWIILFLGTDLGFDEAPATDIIKFCRFFFTVWWTKRHKYNSKPCNIDVCRDGREWEREKMKEGISWAYFEWHQMQCDFVE